MSDNELIYGSAALLNGAVCMDAVLREREEQNILHSLVFFQDEDEWEFLEIDNRLSDFEVVRHTSGEESWVGVTEDGSVLSVIDGKSSWAHVDTTEGGPNSYCHMKSMRQIGEYIYVCGMRGLVYRRHTDGGSWEKIHPLTQEQAARAEDMALLAMTGLQSGELYAVGMDGLILSFEPHGVDLVTSPTNANLHDIACTSNGIAYACGQRGTVVKLSDSHWTVVENETTNEDFWSIVEFQGEPVLAADEFPLFAVRKNSIVKYEQNGSAAGSTGFLRSYGDELLSAGEEDILILRSGDWDKVNCPA